MPLYLLDTDHISLIQRGHAQVATRFRATPAGEIVVSVVSYEEQFRGWLKVISQANTPERMERAYDSLCKMHSLFCGLTMLDFNLHMALIYKGLRQHHRRSGKADLQIAATALSANVTLVTRNTQDFISIANLRLDNWA